MAVTVFAQPSADQILGGARYVTTLSKHDLKGHIRKDGKKVPIALFLKGENIQLQFAEKNKWNSFHLKLKEDQYQLFEIKDGKTRSFPQQKLGEKIAKTDVTYEDMSLRFLYWPNPTVIGEERIMAQDCYKLEVKNPSNTGEYGYVHVWIHKKAGALMRVHSFDRKKKLVRHFEIVELMKIDDDYAVRKMKVSTVKNDRVKGKSYLVFDNPDKKKPRGPKGLR